MESILDQLKTMTEVVADSGDISAIATHKPVDATTNPSLLLKAASLDTYRPLIDEAVGFGQRYDGSSQEQLEHACDHLAVAAGREILRHIPGRVSTEVDARLSFDTRATVEKARSLIDLYHQRDIPNDRVLIKIAATWEGIKAAETLEKEGIKTNLTLLFSFAQAVACADAGAYLISPFVGRILDWHLANSGRDSFAPEEDPGVLSVSRIYRYYKQHQYDTVVMGASFRNIAQIEQLAGCDRLTISPDLLQQLAQKQAPLTRQLSDSHDGPLSAKLFLHEQDFRWQLNEDAMATEKLAEGIRKFAVDQYKLEKVLTDWN